LRESVTDPKGVTATVFERISNAMRWLLKARDARGLSYIAQGDWCDPMNMVGYRGKGVSGWLSVATAYALNVWGEICVMEGAAAKEFKAGAKAVNQSVNKYLWDGQWFARGITDNGVVFGTSKDKEGRIFLETQAWAFLSGAATDAQRRDIVGAVAEQLETPYGPMMLAPAFTGMRDDVGRVTQKFPGLAENGSVYNHGAIFYIYSLYQIGEADRAYRLLREMIPGPAMEDYLQRGQLPVYIPNYYRGAYYLHPRTAGRSSQLFNTGTVSWFYRSLVEGLFGVKGGRESLVIQPQLPSSWARAKVVREFRGATFNIEMRREAGLGKVRVTLDGKVLADNRITHFQAGKTYQVNVTIPG
jgi:cellobionic acid phosphorylase